MNFTRLFEIIHHQNQHYPTQECIGKRVGSNWEFYSTQEVIDQANQLSLGLLELGLERGDKIVQISYDNRPEWKVVEIAASQIGVVLVPVYPTISAHDYEYIFNDASVKYAFLGSGDLKDKVQETAPKVPSFKGYFTFDEVAGEQYWKSLFRQGDYSKITAISETISPESLAVLIYTSGTTGLPKGVMLSHNNIVSNIKSVAPVLPVGEGTRALSFLPLCHIFECTASNAFIARGITIGFTGVRNLGGDNGDIKSFKPHVFTTVPRLLEKVYEKIYNKGLSLSGIKKKLFFWALDIAGKYDFGKKPGFGFKIADKLIFSKWREALGGNMVGIITAAAACPEKIIRVFSAAGISVREAYGLTETSPGLTANRFNTREASVGTVGIPFDGVTIKIDESDGEYAPGEGEILAKGPNIMMGYYNKPEKTAEVMTEDGWFKTGDIGKFVPNHAGVQCLKITDRKKELLKTSGGKYVAPSPIESKFKEDFLIEQMIVIGDKKKFVSALIQPAGPALEDWCKQSGVPCTLTPRNEAGTIFHISEETLAHEKVQALYRSLIQKYNENFSHVEQVKKFTLLAEPWDVSTGELTPTMKLKRKAILKKYENEIDNMY